MPTQAFVSFVAEPKPSLLEVNLSQTPLGGSRCYGDLILNEEVLRTGNSSVANIYLAPPNCVDTWKNFDLLLYTHVLPDLKAMNLRRIITQGVDVNYTYEFAHELNLDAFGYRFDYQSRGPFLVKILQVHTESLDEVVTFLQNYPEKVVGRDQTKVALGFRELPREQLDPYLKEVFPGYKAGALEGTFFAQLAQIETTIGENMAFALSTFREYTKHKKKNKEAE